MIQSKRQKLWEMDKQSSYATELSFVVGVIFAGIALAGYKYLVSGQFTLL